MASNRWLLSVCVLSLLAASGCGADTGDPAGSAGRPGPDDPPASVEPGGTVTIDLDERPFRLHVPESYDPTGSFPLVVLLHGYTSSAAEQESYFRLTGEADRRGFLYAMPDGTTDPRGNRFWNATDACCDFTRTGVDDAAYLRQLIDTVTSSYPVDPARVYLVGHSNGGFMAHRMACDHASVVTAIVSLAGMAPNDAASCRPERPVSVLQIHGTDDDVIPFDGGDNGGIPFPSVDVTLELWRGHNGCGEEGETSEPLDLDRELAGAETTVTTYRAGCRDHGRVELWAIEGGGHVPELADTFAPSVVDFLLTRQRRPE